MLSAVLDTNVVVSGTISSSGAPFEALEAWRKYRRYVLVISPQILAEVARVFDYPKIRKTYNLSSETIEQIILGIAKYAALTPGEFTVEEVHADPADDMVLACAVEGEADFIVSGDKHLLEIGRYRGIPIVTASKFVAELDARTEDLRSED